MADILKYLEELLYEMRGQGVLPQDKEYDNLLSIIEELSPDQYLMLRELNCFTEILKNISFGNDMHLVNGSPKTNKEKNNCSFNLPHPDTHLDDVFFNSDFDKLILRIRNSSSSNSGIKIGEKLSNILELKRCELVDLQGIGKKYVNLWQELINIYGKDNTSLNFEENPLVITKYLNEFDYDTITINYLALNDIEIKNIEKLMRLKGKIFIKDIILFNEKEYSRIKGVGKLFIKTISNLKDKLQSELDRIIKGEINYKKWESDLILPNTFMKISISEFGDMLLDDLDNFLDRLDEEDQEIFQRRWGFVEPQSTLEEIGSDYGITRERIRQKETAINTLLVRYLRFSHENIWLNIKDEIDLQLPSKMENLSSCFDKEINFYRFLEYICGEKDIQNIVRPNIQPDILNVFFARYGSPIKYHEMVSYIEENALLGDVHVDRVLQYLNEIRKIKIDYDKIYPLFLKKNEAAACVLSDHPNGLPWIDVAHLVNARKISRTDLNVTRPDNQALFDSEHIYIAGSGVYKNTKFINFDKIDIDAIFNSLLIFFDETNRDIFHLNEVYRKSTFLQEQDYYVIRYIVKMYGEDYGFYFDGKSQTDSVGLEKNFKSITQKDVILQAMIANNKPMTKPELAILLKSKSLNLASCYIDEMIKNEQIVQVDRMLYTIPEIAYKDIDLPNYVSAIQDILYREKRPTEPSIIQEILNKKLKVSYSKYFYASIAKKFAQKQNWFRKQNLYSLHEIPYKSLTDAVSTHCRKEHSTNDNIEELKKYIAISKDAAQSAISNWQHFFVCNNGI